MQAGEKRVGLNGESVGTVTPAEQRAAEKKVEYIRAKMKRERELAAANALPAVTVSVRPEGMSAWSSTETRKP
jgi:hypothetical protein